MSTSEHVYMRKRVHSPNACTAQMRAWPKHRGVKPALLRMAGGQHAYG